MQFQCGEFLLNQTLFSVFQLTQMVPHQVSVAMIFNRRSQFLPISPLPRPLAALSMTGD